jgi:hypothetical protein
MAGSKSGASQRPVVNTTELNHARKTLIALSAAVSGSAASSRSAPSQAAKQKTR